MGTERSSSEASHTQNLFSRVPTPAPFSPDWHHQFGERLSAFPRYLVAPLEGINCQFWPDLATFVEGPCWSVMMYYPGPSAASICVLHWKEVPRWEAIRFDDECVIAKVSASSYGDLIEALSELAQS